MRGLGQVLKSFRDREVEFSVYRRDAQAPTFLNTLGPLVKPGASRDAPDTLAGPGSSMG